MSDSSTVSVGARNQYGDSFGTLVTTAVLVKTPTNIVGDPAWAYRPTRVDVLFMQQPNQAPFRVCTDFLVTLYADDGSTDHNPAQQLTVPYLLTGSTGLVTFRAVWLQNDITQAEWPILTAQTYYWVAVTPSTPLTMPPLVPGGPNTLYNGAVWSGINTNVARPSDGSLILPGFIRNDPYLFTGRELVSERAAFDPVFMANQPDAVTFLSTAENWPTVPNADTRFTNWQATGSNVRYGIQIIGWQVTPSNTPSMSCESVSMNCDPSSAPTRTPTPAAACRFNVHELLK